MRLNTLSRSLTEYFLSQNNHKLFETFFDYCRLDVLYRVGDLSPENIPCFLRNRNFPGKDNYMAMSAYYDERYFFFEESGNIVKSGIYFSLARLCASLDLFYENYSPENVCEALYECSISTKSPDQAIRNFEELIPTPDTNQKGSNTFL